MLLDYENTSDVQENKSMILSFMSVTKLDVLYFINIS